MTFSERLLCLCLPNTEIAPECPVHSPNTADPHWARIARNEIAEERSAKWSISKERYEIAACTICGSTEHGSRSMCPEVMLAKFSDAELLGEVNRRPIAKLFLGSISDNELKSEWAKRNSWKRKTKGGGAPRGNLNAQRQKTE